MILNVLTIEENAYSGFSHEATITYADLAALTGGTGAQYIVIGKCADGDVINRAGSYCDTAFTFSDGTISSCALTVVDNNASPNTLLASQELISGSVVSTQSTAVIGVYTAAKEVRATFTPTSSKNLNTATAGSVRILYSKNSLKKYTNA